MFLCGHFERENLQPHERWKCSPSIASEKTVSGESAVLPWRNTKSLNEQFIGPTNLKLHALK